MKNFLKNTKIGTLIRFGIFFFSTFSAIFLFASQAHGALFNQLDNSTSTFAVQQLYTNAGCGGGCRQDLGSTISGSATGFNIQIDGLQSTTANYKVYFTESSSAYASTTPSNPSCSGNNNPAGVSAYYQISLTATSSQETNISFASMTAVCSNESAPPSTFTFQNGKFYNIQFFPFGSPNYFNIWGSTASSSYAQGQFLFPNAGFNADSSWNVKDMFLRWVGYTPPPPANPMELTLLYPQNSTSTFIHDFNAFSFVATNTDSNAHNFTFKITYDTSSTLQQNPVSVSRNVSYAFGAGSTHFLNIPKPQILASSTTYYAELCGSSDGSTTSTLCTDLTTFQLGLTQYGQQIDTSQAGWFSGTSTEAGILFNNTLPPVSNGSEYCNVQFYDPSSWACWTWLQVKSGVDQLGNYAGAGIERIASTTEDIFPLQIFFALNADFQNLNTTTTDSQITLTGTGNAYKKVGGGYYTFTILSTSTAKASENATGFDWESFIANVIYLLDGVAMVGVAFALLHKSSHTKK